MFNLLASAFMSFAAMIGGLFGAPASTTTPHDGMMGGSGPMGSSTEMHEHVGSTTPGMGPGVYGVVDSISGTTLTIDGKAGPQSATTTYTVDASSAKIVKQKVGTSTVSSIAQGDHVLVQGTVSGTSIIAKMIIDGVMPMMHMGGKNGSTGQQMGSSTGHMPPMRGGMQGMGGGSQGGQPGQDQGTQSAGQ